MPIVNRKHGSVKFSDATGTPIEATLGPGEGNLTISGIQENGWETESVKDRGEHLEWVYTQQAELSGSITLYHDGDLTDGTAKVPLDAVTKTGAFAAGVSTDDGEVWAGKLTATWTRGAVVHTLSIANARFTADYSEGSPTNQITINFTGYGSVTKTSA